MRASRPRSVEIDGHSFPSGASGLLVSSLGAFARYQENEAWTWEHQALVRARVLVGSEDVGRAFEKVRAAVLGKSRDLATLRQEVSEMRAKMRDNLGSKSTEFEQRYLLELQSGVDRALPVFADLDKLISKIRSDCE